MLQHTNLTDSRCPRAGSRCSPQQFLSGILATLSILQQIIASLGEKYSALDQELSALYLGVRHFRYFLEGREFIAYTHHRPLTFSMANISDPLSSQQQRHLAYISEFTADIRHIQGMDNHLADTLSRATFAVVQVGFDYDDLVACWKDDTD